VTDHVALVDVTGVQIWFFTFQEITELAQQEKDGMMHFYMYIDPTAKIRPDSKPHHDYEFRRYLVENVIPRFGISKKPNKSEQATPRKPSDQIKLDTGAPLL